MAVIYDKVALIGLGLIAGSMAHAMRRAGAAGEIVGTARSAETRAVAAEIIPAMKSGAVLLECSTVDVESARARRPDRWRRARPLQDSWRSGRSH